MLEIDFWSKHSSELTLLLQWLLATVQSGPGVSLPWLSGFIVFYNMEIWGAEARNVNKHTKDSMTKYIPTTDKNALHDNTFNLV